MQLTMATVIANAGGSTRAPAAHFGQWSLIILNLEARGPTRTHNALMAGICILISFYSIHSTSDPKDCFHKIDLVLTKQEHVIRTR